MATEAHLLDEARAGSVEAFTELVHAYRGRLLRFLLTRCASYADAEDVLQDTLISAYRYIRTYDSRWRFSTWLYRIAIRIAANQQRAGFVDIADVRELRDEGNDPLLQCIADSESDNLWVSARRLFNDDVFAAMWLRYAEDMSVGDISKTLDHTESWTKVNLMRGRRALERELRDGAPGNEAYG